MIRRLAWMLAALLLWSGPAAAQPETDEQCWDNPNRASCLQSRADQLVETYGVRRIEAHRDTGDRVLRVFYWHNQDLALIAFVRSPGQEPRALVSFPRRPGIPVPAVMEAAIPQAIWDEAMNRAVYADRTFVPTPPSQSDGQTICIHPTVYVFEASDPAVPIYGMRARIRRHSAHTCDDAPLLQFAADFRRLALPLFPACDALDPGVWGDQVSRLVTCQRLSGDRLAAAQILNLAEAFRLARGPDDLRDVRGLIGADAAIDWNGRRRRAEEPGPAAFWLVRMAEDHVSFVSIEAAEGVSSERIRITGRLLRSRPGTTDGSQMEARFEQIWTPTGSGTQVTSITVGPWEPRPE